MKNLMKLSFIIIVVSVLLLSSCNNNSTNPTTPAAKNYFPMTSLSDFWIYQKYKLDTTAQTGVFKIVEPFSIDSTNVSNTSATKIGQNCIEMATSNYDDHTTLYDYFYKNGQQLYALSDFVLPTELRTAPIALPLSISTRWVLLADNASASDTWTIFDTTLTNVAYNISTYSVTINGDYKITATRQAEASVEVDSGSVKKYYTAKEFRVVHTFTGTVNYLYFNINFPYSVTLHYWYVDNIGLVKYQLDPLEINLSLAGQNISFNNPGVVKNLIKYKVQ